MLLATLFKILLMKKLCDRVIKIQKFLKIKMNAGSCFSKQELLVQ